MTQRAMTAIHTLSASWSAIFSLSLALLPVLASAATGNTQPEADEDEVLATVGGQPITREEVYAQARIRLERAQREFEIARHDVLEAELQQTIRDRLLGLEAAERKTSGERLLDEIKIPAVTSADIDRFYEENKARIARPKAEVAATIKDYLQLQGKSEAEQAYWHSLEKKFAVVTLLEPLRAEIADSGPSRGGDSAPVTLIEFADFKCPFCMRFVPTLRKIEEAYGDKVRIVFRQYPIDSHAEAPKAAEASLCANDQHMFWEMHDAMFEHQADLSVERLKSLASGLGIRSKTFNKCLDSGKYAAQVEADRDAGMAAGVDGTPALFINGRVLNGAVELDAVIRVIDDELDRIDD